MDFGKRKTGRKSGLTPERVMAAFEKKLESYRDIENYRYSCFYRALGAKLAPNPEGRATWQGTIIDYMEADSGGLEAFYDRVTSALGVFAMRESYPLIRKNFPDHCKKTFPTKKKSEENRLENCIKFNLIHNDLLPFGRFIGYELPLFQSSNSGAIDCIAYNAEERVLRLIEIKAFGLGEIPDSGEQLLRALTEIITYRAGFERILKTPRALSRLQTAFDDEYKGIDLKTVTVKNCIFAPAVAYETVDERIKAFLSDTQREEYQTELYTISPHADITEHIIGCGKILFDIESVRGM